MSSRSFVRLTMFSLCGLAMVLSGLAEALVAQQVPPPLPPPEVSRPGGGNDQDASGRRGGPPPSVGARGRRGGSGIRGASSGMGNAKPKFEDLLENQDLSRFRGYKDERIGDGWDIDGKYLYFDGSSGSGDIVTVDEYENFELQFDFKVTEGGNSGVMYRVSLGDDQPYISGPEYQVLDDEEHPDGQNELTSAGSLYGMYAPENKKSRKAGTWNQARIVVNGNNVKHYLNGVKVVEAEIGSDDWNDRLDKSKFKDWEKYAKNSRGHIAFQDHGNEVWYRKIRIKNLTDETASSSRDLAPTHVAPVVVVHQQPPVLRPDDGPISRTRDPASKKMMTKTSVITIKIAELIHAIPVACNRQPVRPVLRRDDVQISQTRVLVSRKRMIRTKKKTKKTRTVELTRGIPVALDHLPRHDHRPENVQIFQTRALVLESDKKKEKEDDDKKDEKDK